MIVVIDNYDSFTFNLVQLIETLTPEPVVVHRNDGIGVAEVMASKPRAIVISPGPGVPSRAGISCDLVREAGAVPLLGVCLGHQAIAEALGGRVIRGAVAMHGKVDEIRHDGEGLFASAPQPMYATRYHSLVVERETLPAELRVDAESGDGTVMALSHRERPLYGVQFHPESYGTVGGETLLRRFLDAATIERRAGVEGER